MVADSHECNAIVCPRVQSLVSRPDEKLFKARSKADVRGIWFGWHERCFVARPYMKNYRTRNGTTPIGSKSFYWWRIVPLVIALAIAPAITVSAASANDAGSAAGGNDVSSNSEKSGSGSSSSDKSDSDKSSANQGQASGTPSAIQSQARPGGLSIIGPVMQAGSDAAGKNFQTVLPSMEQFLNKNLPEQQNNSKNPLVFSINPAKLITLATKSDVTAYFAYEGAGYHNTVGFNTTGVGVSSGDPKIIFPDASSSIGYGGAGSGVRSASEPLLPGDFVNLGTYGAGSKLNFFLIANGAYGGSTVLTASASSNPDGINHVASFTPGFWGVANSPYVFLSFEDLLGGGDKDFNDVVIALNIGAANVAALLATPEPATWLTLVSLVGVVAWAMRRSRNQVLATVTSSRA